MGCRRATFDRPAAMWIDRDDLEGAILTDNSMVGPVHFVPVEPKRRAIRPSSATTILFAAGAMVLPQRSMRWRRCCRCASSWPGSSPARALDLRPRWGAMHAASKQFEAIAGRASGCRTCTTPR